LQILLGGFKTLFDLGFFKLILYCKDENIQSSGVWGLGFGVWGLG